MPGLILSWLLVGTAFAQLCPPNFSFSAACGPASGRSWSLGGSVCAGEPIACRSILFNDSPCDMVLWYYHEYAQFPGDIRSGDQLPFAWDTLFPDTYLTPPNMITSWASTDFVLLPEMVATTADLAQGFKHVVVHHSAASALVPFHAERANDFGCDTATGACHVDIPVDIPVRDCSFGSTSTSTSTTTTLVGSCRLRICADGSLPKEIITCPCWWQNKKIKCGVLPQVDCSAKYYVYRKHLCSINLICPEDLGG